MGKPFSQGLSMLLQYYLGSLSDTAASKAALENQKTMADYDARLKEQAAETAATRDLKGRKELAETEGAIAGERATAQQTLKSQLDEIAAEKADIRAKEMAKYQQNLGIEGIGETSKATQTAQLERLLKIAKNAGVSDETLNKAVFEMGADNIEKRGFSAAESASETAKLDTRMTKASGDNIVRATAADAENKAFGAEYQRDWTKDNKADITAGLSAKAAVAPTSVGNNFIFNPYTRSLLGVSTPPTMLQDPTTGKTSFNWNPGAARVSTAIPDVVKGDVIAPGAFSDLVTRTNVAGTNAVSATPSPLAAKPSDAISSFDKLMQLLNASRQFGITK